jgi:MFS family permease
VSEEVQQDLDLTDSQYGLGAGIFFVSYTLFQVPSQMILVRVGTRTWLGMMAFAWGLACCAMAFSTDAEYFYRARFALGLTEAGFFPGVISYLRTFVPMSKFSYAFGLISSACCVAMVMGGPIAAVVFKLTKDTDTDKLSADQEEIDGPMGLTTWQWLFLCQGAPVVLLGLILPCWLPSEPSEIVFKGPEASNLRKVYLQRLKSESFANAARAEKSDDEELATLKEKTVAGCATLCSLCFEPRMWAFATSIFFHSLGFWGVIFWVPRVVGGVLASSSSLGKTDGPDSSDSHGFAAVHLSHHAVKIFHETNSTHLSPDVLDLQIANFKTVSVVVLLLSAIPYMGAVVGNLWVAWHSDKYNERKMHVIGACALGSFGLVLTASTLHRPMLNLLALTLTAGAFWGVSG